MANGNIGSAWSNKENIALCQFKDKLKDLDLSNPILEDRRLINWLRARDLSIPNAEKMLRAHLEWRQRNKIDNLFTSDLAEECSSILASLPFDVVGHDRQGNTIMIFCSGAIDVKALLQTHGKATGMNVIHYMLEMGYADVVEHSTDPQVLKKATCICDLDGIRFKDYLSADVLDVLINSLKTVEANYPEMLNKAYIINAPFIYPVLWNILKPFMSPATIAKVDVIGCNVDKIQSTLTETISADELPKKWGGTGLSQKLSFLNENNNLNGSSSSNKNKNSEEDLKKTVIPAGEFFDISFDVDSPKARLSWSFKTTNHDIGFSLLHKPFQILNSKNSKNSTTEKISYKRLNAQKMVQSGCFICDVVGHYILRFDNTYSRFREKTLFHHVEMT